MPDEIRVQCIVSQPFQENTYVVWRAGKPDALVIDAGLEPELIEQFLQQQGLTAAAILCTHGHADHIAGNSALKQAFPDAPLIIGENETHLLSDPMANLSGSFGFSVTSPPADRTVKEGDALEFAGISLDVLDVPGHSPGHVAYLHRGSPFVIFSGDVLFRGGIGRDDFPGSDGAKLRKSIVETMLALPDDTMVYSGHGEPTTIGTEKLHNPFL